MIIQPLLVKSLTDHLRGTIAWAMGVVAIVAVQLSVYPSIRDSQKEVGNLADAFPEAFQKIFRMQDYTSEIGYLSTELFTATLPLIFIAIAVTWGSRLMTEEEDRGTADVFFALPITRHSYTATRFMTVAAVLVIVALALLLSLIIGTELLDFSVPLSSYVAGAWVNLMLGAVFATLAAAIGAWTGRRGVALGVSVTLAIGFFVLYSLAPLVDSIDATTPFNPLQWTIGTQPLSNGFDAGYSITVILVTTAFEVVTFLGFRRRDITS
jgi:ABC-2 type transport system permease protein